MKSVQIIVNGEIFATVKSQPLKTDLGTYQSQIDTPVSLNGSGWIAVRCFEDLLNEKVSFAHTNPAYVDVTGSTVRPRKDRVKFLVKRMDEEIARNTGILSDEAIAEFREARAAYASLLDLAR